MYRIRAVDIARFKQYYPIRYTGGRLMHAWQWILVFVVVLHVTWSLVVLWVVQSITKNGGKVYSDSWHYDLYCIAADCTRANTGGKRQKIMLGNIKEYRDTLWFADFWFCALIFCATLMITCGFLTRVANILTHWLLVAEIVDFHETKSFWEQMVALPEESEIVFRDIPQGYRNPWWIGITCTTLLVIIVFVALTT